MDADKDIINWLRRLNIVEATGDDKFDSMMSDIQKGVPDPVEIENKIEQDYTGIDIDSRYALIDFSRYLLLAMDKGYKAPAAIKNNQSELSKLNNSQDPTVKKVLHEFNRLANIPGTNQNINSATDYEEDILEIQSMLFGEYKGFWDDKLNKQMRLLIDPEDF